jgi:HK97 gp10 family phage protein
MQIIVNLDGDDRIIRKFDAFSKYLKSSRLRNILVDYKNKLVAQSKENAPLGRTGNLRKGILGKILNWGSDSPSIEVRVKNEVEYAAAVHDGSPRHGISGRPRLFWVDNSKSGVGGTRYDYKGGPIPKGHYVHRPFSVNHPGQKENPFMEKAANQLQPRLLMAILRDMNDLAKERGG